MTASTSVSDVINPSLQAKESRKHDYEQVEDNSDELNIMVEKSSASEDQEVALITPHTQRKTTVHKNLSNRKWFVLTSFSLLSFSNAVLWITFGPCLYIFMEHYQQTPSTINALATVFMIIYPILLVPVLNIYDKWGLRQGILVGAFLNAFGTFLRFMGSFGPSGFWLLFLGQTISAIAGVFILGVPPKLANTWFEFGEQNLATGIGVTANNAGIAVGFLLSPWFIKQATAKDDIPKYLLIQFATTTLSTIYAFCTDKVFMLLATSYGLTVGASFAVSTLLAQIVVPVFRVYDESQIGFLGFLNVVAGMVGSVLIGIYLDRTFAYKRSCRTLYMITFLSLFAFIIALKIKSMPLLTVSCMFFGISSFAITPALFQYVPVITSSRLGEDEITSTGILNSVVQICGILLVVLMDATENVDQQFTMELSCWLLLAIVFIGIILIWLVKED
ncbi:11300_t:CDS:2 [Funneliformis mosseae]|uniref:11300_t:CDS:1 n=1 Tax=Funneliformis mosseae TaxID=27381 RepID=A0A9N9BJI9_FUNMO|nr:11300_t:CDS:2 [Funneliformis mosseae]